LQDKLLLNNKLRLCQSCILYYAVWFRVMDLAPGGHGNSSLSVLDVNDKCSTSDGMTDENSTVVAVGGLQASVTWSVNDIVHSSVML